MARILAYTSPAIGHLFPLVPVLLELAERGHEVHVRTLANRVDLVREQGLAAEPIDPHVEAVTHVLDPGGSRAGLEAAGDVFARRAAFDGPDLARAIEEGRPDLLVVDTNSWGAIATAQAQQRPWVEFCPYIPPLPAPGTPPFGPGLPRRTDLLGRVRDAVDHAFLDGLRASTLVCAGIALGTAIVVGWLLPAREPARPTERVIR